MLQIILKWKIYEIYVITLKIPTIDLSVFYDTGT